LLAFVREQAPQTDLFCFQEVLAADEIVPVPPKFHTRLFAELVWALPDFEGRFDRMVTWTSMAEDGRAVTIPFGPATFARRTLPIDERSATTIIHHLDHLDAAPGLHKIARPLQLTRVSWQGRSLLVGNYHGLAQPGSKLDSDERLAQSTEIRRVLADSQVNQDSTVVLIGDFNLLPETESIRMLECEYRNLIAEHAISTTRSRLNPFFGKPGEQRFADYAFVSSGVRVTSFEVPDVEISDHLPLILEVAW